ncbi:transglutaminase family protein [uncultured Sphingomonas sp.]|uniref:transglutaminase-like domain-containing protein n=1 Tax=uncultured Sphingomonas sp. TaxID=158754 RepID=UPI0035CA9CA8
MKLAIHSTLDYFLAEPTDLLLQVEAAHLPEQIVESGNLVLSTCDHFARMQAQDAIGERIWLRAQGRFTADYVATVDIQRRLAAIEGLAAMPPHRLPGETVPYLLDSRYCPAGEFHSFVEGEFGGTQGGSRIAALRDFIHDRFRYVPGSSTGDTTARETFVRREGVCRDFAHILITLARASVIPARIASVYAVGVDPPDFHAVAEVFLGGEWHLVDATGMATEGQMAKIGIGRDAADVAFLTAFGRADMNSQRIEVSPA